jgi:hypothetical protein
MRHGRLTVYVQVHPNAPLEFPTGSPTSPVSYLARLSQDRKAIKGRLCVRISWATDYSVVT